MKMRIAKVCFYPSGCLHFMTVDVEIGEEGLILNHIEVSKEDGGISIQLPNNFSPSSCTEFPTVEFGDGHKKAELFNFIRKWIAENPGIEELLAKTPTAGVPD